MRLKDRYGAFARTGSFGWEGLDPESSQLARSMTYLNRSTQLGPRMLEAAHRASGDRVVKVYNVDVPFDPAQVGQLGADLQRRVVDKWKEDGGAAHVTASRPSQYDLGMAGWGPLDVEDPLNVIHIETEGCQYLLTPSTQGYTYVASYEDMTPRYLVSIPMGMRPQTILATGGRALQAGMEFQVGMGVLVFVRDPSELFKDHCMHVMAATQVHGPLHRYVLQVDGLRGPGKHVMSYYRDRQTALSFEKALREVAGLIQCPGGELLYASPYCAGVHYTFTGGGVHITYPHDELTVGDIYEEGLWIGGDSLQVVSATGTTSQGWHRRLTWQGGLSLDGLCPFDGIVVPDANVRTWSQATGPGDEHVRMDLLGDETSVDKYWNHVLSAELITGNYLNAAVGLASSADVKFINGLDFYFDHLLGSSGMVVAMSEQTLGVDARLRVRDFIARERPVGASVIIRDL